MKILLFNWRCWKHPEAGGAEKYLYEICKRLAKKHEITWFVARFKGSKEREFIDGMEIIRRGGKYTVYLHALLTYVGKLRKRGFDVVIDDINGVPFFTPLYIWKPRKIAIVHHLVGWKIFSLELPWYLAIVAWFLERLIPLFYLNVCFVTVSPSSKKELEKMFIRRIKVIYNGLDERFKRGLKEVKKHKKPVIIYLGRWKKYKRIDDILEAFRIVKKRVKDAELWLVGKNIKEIKMKDVKVFQRVSEEEKMRLLKKAWVFVTASIKEGWGITVIEANACGTPAIAYDVPGLRDSIVDGKTGFLVKEDGNAEKLAEAIIRVLTDDKLRDELSRNAIEWAKRFSWDRSAEEFEKIIKGVVNGK